MDKTWSVVQFEEENAVEAVPSSWIYNNKCYWPPFNKEKLLKFIKNNEEPNTCWPLHPVKIFRNGIYDDYLTARKKCQTAEMFSDLCSDTGDEKSSRKKRTKKVFSPESSPISTSEDEKERGCKPKKNSLPPAPILVENPVRLANSNARGPRSDANNILSPKGSSSSSTSSLGSMTSNLGSALGNGRVIEHPRCDNTNEIRVDVSATESGCCKMHGKLLTDLVRKQNILFQYIKEIHGYTVEMDQTLKKIDTNNKPSEINETCKISFIKDFNFPLSNEEDLTGFEEYLSNDVNYAIVVKEVVKIGGIDINQFVKRGLSFCISNRLAETYTYFGKKGKKNFSELKLCSVLFDAVFKKFKDSSRKDIETSIKNWMRRAKERK
ncbi:unnamed protein product [Ceutorhynchus assimilis]|uniref:DUF4806 domain-containing protein n=1 Tax=Ceutorhynchus assimilis TaxID=467358 RepID=A0A9P0DYX2_9CUCU|nr:unnamed protein product [Ceutorhynchus assimilis]CAG9761240.1 unnamed protein product [Ceutorhynchus assimilis]CAG9762449.1 unnamed protein product [Ceutorhynchus assimilis]CAG9762606.1 unnamed protein product [Ceutorhynchus assimilis]CAG9765743.1 unnamed protein product [Ceutorhynchus assimilis]